MALSQWRIGRALDVELAAFSPDGLDAALLSLALRYRTAAERAWYKALTELQRLRTNAVKELEAHARAAQAQSRRDLEALCFAPIMGAQPPAPAPGEFVSQTHLPGPAAGEFVSQNHPAPLGNPSTGGKRLAI